MPTYFLLYPQVKFTTFLRHFNFFVRTHMKSCDTLIMKMKALEV